MMINKLKLFVVLFFFISTSFYAQTPQTIIKTDYTVTSDMGAQTIIATESITIKPTSTILFGSNFVAKISSDAYSALNFSNENYIFTRNYKKALKNSSEITSNRDVIEYITYFDGLGRPMQKIDIKGSPAYKDIVTHMGYDMIGRKDKDYLPYSDVATPTASYRNNAVLNTNNYYISNYPDEINSANPNPFSQKKFEDSPDDRILEQAAPGADWALGNGHEIRQEYQTNLPNEVKLYSLTLSLANNTYSPSLSQIGHYGAGQLYKTITKNENWISGTNNTTEEFKDKKGQVILKKTYGVSVVNNVEINTTHETYYIFDDYGNLNFVLPPKADGGFTTSILNDLCYQYKYDTKNRLVEKKLPGMQWEFIVYDKLDRPVATGPANSPFSDIASVGWIITKYDVFNRPVYTGWINSVAATTQGRTSLQNDQNASTLNVINEDKLTSGTLDGISAYYSNLVAPTNFRLLSVNYYDNYNFPNSTIVIPTNVEGQNTLVSNQAKGLATAFWIRTLSTSNLNSGETKAIFYDVKARPIRNYLQNYLGGYTYTDNKLDPFSGQLQYSITKHKRTASDAELTTKESFTYSAQERLLTQTHQINGGLIELITNNTYDELGNLIYKKTGNTVELPTQKVDYKYNIRGWLTNINDINSLSKAGDPKDLFAFKINYNGIADATKKLYNGNISQTFWLTDNIDKTLKNYVYTYDNLNRLKTATDNTGFFNENMTYDKNGNIVTLKRTGHLVGNPSINNPANYGLMDDLTYTYDNGNRLQTVSDLGNDYYGFKDDATGAGVVDTTVDYTYDANGNMLTDANKGITTNIVYNHLNLPTKIILPTGNITYLYNAAGQKLQKTVTITSPASVTTTDYLDGYQYKNAILKFFPTAEGYVEPIPPTGSYKYVYQYKDQIGNIRLSYDKMLVVQEENNYYAFGLRHLGYNNTKISSNDVLNYKYQNQERQDELELNWDSFKWRNYDASISRFMTTDPLSEKYAYQSHYNFSENRVIDGVELEGLEVVLLNNATKNQPVITAANSGQYKDDPATKTIHVFAHGNPSEFYNDIGKTAINTGQMLNKTLNEMSSLWKNSKSKEGFTVVIHACRTGRYTLDKNGNLVDPIAAKISASKEMIGVAIIAPDERDGFSAKGKEIGPQMTKNVDFNGDYLFKNSPHGIQSHKFGNWNTFMYGRLIYQTTGQNVPKNRVVVGKLSPGTVVN
ncbi:DUF6443 domain-containing protein [Flavobacterium tructae]|uniref:DUF6443 domain-containing protein n=1 Tax=Flavobacterium tructae TaxID=1114873 RepID=UPI0035A91E32